MQRSIFPYALFLELSQVEDPVHWTPVRTKVTLRLWHHLRGDVAWESVHWDQRKDFADCAKEEIYVGKNHILFNHLFCRWSLCWHPCWHPCSLVVHGLPVVVVCIPRYMEGMGVTLFFRSFYRTASWLSRWNT